MASRIRARRHSEAQSGQWWGCRIGPSGLLSPGWGAVLGSRLGGSLGISGQLSDASGGVRLVGGRVGVKDGKGTGPGVAGGLADLERCGCGEGLP